MLYKKNLTNEQNQDKQAYRKTRKGKDVNRQFWKGNLNGQYGDLSHSNNPGSKN